MYGRTVSVLVFIEIYHISLSTYCVLSMVGDINHGFGFHFIQFIHLAEGQCLLSLKLAVLF